MDMASLPPASSMSKSTLASLDSDLPFARNFDVALRQAQELRKRGELDQASRVLAQLVLASPDDPRVVGEYGKVMLESGRTNDAVAFLERAVDLQPSDWSLFSALGVAYDQSGKREPARAAFQRALTIKPGESTVLSNLAVSHMQAGELDEAERLLLQASEQSKDVARHSSEARDGSQYQNHVRTKPSSDGVRPPPTRSHPSGCSGDSVVHDRSGHES